MTNQNTTQSPVKPVDELRRAYEALGRFVAQGKTGRVTLHVKAGRVMQAEITEYETM